MDLPLIALAQRMGRDLAVNAEWRSIDCSPELVNHPQQWQDAQTTYRTTFASFIGRPHEEVTAETFTNEQLKDALSWYRTQVDPSFPDLFHLDCDYSAIVVYREPVPGTRTEGYSLLGEGPASPVLRIRNHVWTQHLARDKRTNPDPLTVWPTLLRIHPEKWWDTELDPLAARHITYGPKGQLFMGVPVRTAGALTDHEMTLDWTDPQGATT